MRLELDYLRNIFLFFFSVKFYGNPTLFTWAELFYKSFEFATKNSQILGWRAAVSCWLHICSKWLWTFKNYFLKWTWKLNSLASFTCTLTPTKSRLIKVEAFWFKQLFALRPSIDWGHENFMRTSASIVLVLFSIL